MLAVAAVQREAQQVRMVRRVQRAERLKNRHADRAARLRADLEQLGSAR